MVIIYQYTNKITGKKYIGQTLFEDQRKASHKHEALVKNSQFYFHRSIRKHGWENFDYEVLCEVPENEAISVESKYITGHNTLWPNGYNEQLPMNRMTESVRNKISKAHKQLQRKKTKEEKNDHAKMMRSFRKKHQSDKQKEAVRKANSKIWKITFPDGRVEIITNLRQFGRENNVDQGNLIKYGHSKGFKVERYVNITNTSTSK